MLNDIHICSVNVKGLRNKEKRLRFYEWVKRQKCDIIYMQETHFDINIENDMKIESNFDYFYSHGTSNSCGQAILIHKQLNCDIIEEQRDSHGRILLLNVEIENNIYSLVNVYAPNNGTERNAFYRHLKDFINVHAIGTLILGGDMNDALTDLDRKISNKTRNKCIKPVNSLKVLIKTNKLIDIWRKLNPKKIQFTWRRLNPPQASRIDMFFIPDDLVPNIKSCDIRPITIKSTDHQAISIKIQTSTAKSKGPGHWKLNNSVLAEETYVRDIEKIIQNFQIQFNNENNNKRLLWDMLKIEIKEYSMQYCKNRAKIRKDKVTKMESELHDLNVKNNVNSNDSLLEKINSLENILEQEYVYLARGAQIRSKVEWFEKGEKNNKFFLGLEKSKQTKKTIIKLKDTNGDIITDQSQILKMETDFYQNLYSENTRTEEDKLLNYINNCELQYKLNDLESKQCDGYITLEEITIAVNKLKINKSPGFDGLSTNFYRKFWKLLGPILVQVYNESYDKTEMSFSQRRSILNLIYKKNDPLELTNYRPISLLNSDYKILSYALANRVKRSLSLLINTDQTGYISNRFLGLNLRIVQDAIEYADRFSIGGALLFIDFSKAFDTLN